MPSLADLFNPSFLMFLGILVLVAALLVVYFETKNREQTHKITSMFSLVSSLAEEVNNIKMNLTQISLQQNGGFLNKDLNNMVNSFDLPNGVFRNNDNKNNNNLISVSDDDNNSNSDSDSDSENSESDDENDLESINSSNSNNDENYENDEDDNLSNDNHNDVKILKLNIQTSTNILQEESDTPDLDYHNEVDGLEELDDFDELNDELSESQSVSSKISINVDDNNLENQLINTLDDNLNSNLDSNNTEVLDISSSDFKTININLEDSTTENIDYKKLSIPKLRSIVAEKKLSSDTSKLKKPELLKLLGVE